MDKARDFGGRVFQSFFSLAGPYSFNKFWKINSMINTGRDTLDVIILLVKLTAGIHGLKE
jgi:hypothetical protein